MNAVLAPGLAQASGAARPQVSIVIPVYNGAATLATCLQSVVDQDYPSDRMQVVVVDNGSTDDTPEVIERYRDRIVTCQAHTRGPAAARNCGIRAATGEIIALIDADCIAEESWLRHLVAPLADPAVGIAGGRILATRPCNAIEAYGEEIHDHEAALTRYRPPYAISMNWASRRDVLVAAGLFDEAFRRPAGEDVDLAYRIGAHGYRLTFVAEAVIRHRNEDGYGGLFREGYRHGFHAVHLNRKHAALLAAHGYRRVSLGRYARLARAVRRALVTRDARARCLAVFTGAKSLGKIAGSIRFGYIDL